MAKAFSLSTLQCGRVGERLRRGDRRGIAGTSGGLSPSNIGALVQRNRRCKHSSSFTCSAEASVAQVAIEGISSISFLAKALYMQAQEAHPVAMDGLTAGFLYTLSDLFAQWQTAFTAHYRARTQQPQTEMVQVTSSAPESEQPVAVTTLAETSAATEPVGGGGIEIFRTARYGVFGIADGSLSHFWFQGLDSFIPASNLQAVVSKMAIDCAFFTPTWCFCFLSFMALTDGAGVQGAAERLRSDWRTLYFGNVGAWLPANAVLYGVVPLQQRVAAFAAFTLLYTVVLSWWAEDPERARCESGAGVCEVEALSK